MVPSTSFGMGRKSLISPASYLQQQLPGLASRGSSRSCSPWFSASCQGVVGAEQQQQWYRYRARSLSLSLSLSLCVSLQQQSSPHSAASSPVPIPCARAWNRTVPRCVKKNEIAEQKKTRIHIHHHTVPTLTFHKTQLFVLLRTDRVRRNAPCLPGRVCTRIRCSAN